MKQELVSIDGHSVAKVLGATYVLIGLVFGLLATILSFLTEGFSVMLLVPMLLLPVLYGVLGYLAAWLMALLYNVVAKRIGGIVLTFSPRKDSSPEA